MFKSKPVSLDAKKIVDKYIQSGNFGMSAKLVEATRVIFSSDTVHSATIPQTICAFDVFKIKKSTETVDIRISTGLMEREIESVMANAWHASAEAISDYKYMWVIVLSYMHGYPETLSR